jgi:hypothetical protein
MIQTILILLCWGTAGGIAYWFTDTVGSKLKCADPVSYEAIKTDAEGTLNTLIETENKTKETQESMRDTAQGGIDSKESGRIREDTPEYSKALQTIQQAKKKIAESEAKIKWYNTIKEKGLDSIEFTWGNVAKTAGIFFGVGLTLHWIVKSIMKIFKNKE